MNVGRLSLAVPLLACALAATACGGAPPQPPEPSQLDHLAWMAGSWEGEERGARVEEQWMWPRGDTMLGLHRDLLPTGEVLFEFLRIQQEEGGPIYWASPMGGEATPFRLVEFAPGRAVFENAAHDFPQRIVYWKEGRALRARVEGDVDGEPRGIEWTFRPVAPVSRGAAAGEATQ